MRHKCRRNIKILFYVIFFVYETWAGVTLAIFFGESVHARDDPEINYLN